MKIVRPFVKTVGSLSVTVRDANRFREVAVTLAKHGLGALVAGVDIPGLQVDSEYNSTPQRLVEALQELGPTFIKFGQILSTRSDIVPLDYLIALQQLQDDVHPLQFDTLKDTLREDLGHKWDELVETIDATPLATASIAQVHQAVLKDGTKVVFKIRRPKIDSIIDSDLHILRFLLERFLHEFPEMELFDPRGMFLEFERALSSELDFRLELKNLQQFHKSFYHMEGIRFPEPIEALSSHRVLCMEFLEGVQIRKAREMGFDMEVIGERYLSLAYTMLFDHGFFHGDLHPGNVLVLPDQSIGVLDCGMVGRLTREMKDQLATLIYSLYRGDNKLIAKIFFEISIKKERIDYIAFERDAVQVAEKHWSGGSFSEMDIGAFLMDLTTNALRHKVYAPTAFTMFFKAVLTTEGLAKSLLPEVDPLKVAQPYVEKLVKARWQPQHWTELGTQNALAFSSILKRLPISMSQLLDDLDYQRLQFKVEHIERSKDQKAAMRRQGLLVLGLLAFGWLMVASVGWIYKGPSVLFGVGFGISIILQLYIVGVLWRTYKDD